MSISIRRVGHAVSMTVVAVLLLVIESAICVVVFRNPQAAVRMLAIHGVVSCLAGWWLAQPRRRHGRHALLLWMMTTVCGPLGAGGVVLAIVLERVHAAQRASLEEWHEMLFPENVADEQAELWRRIGQRASDRPADQPVTPFLDVLAFGSVSQRQAVVAIIAQQFRPAFAPALKAALLDEHNVVRVQAATAIARLEQEFLERTLELQGALGDGADDPAAHLALATHYDDQAFNGLLDPARQEECRDKAIDGYKWYLTRRPDDKPVELRLARLHLRRRELPEAEARLRRLTECGCPRSNLWLMEALFEQGQFSELRTIAAGCSDASDPTLAADAIGSIDLWSQQEALV